MASWRFFVPLENFLSLLRTASTTADTFSSTGICTVALAEVSLDDRRKDGGVKTSLSVLFLQHLLRLADQHWDANNTIIGILLRFRRIPIPSTSDTFDIAHLYLSIRWHIIQKTFVFGSTRVQKHKIVVYYTLQLSLQIVASQVPSNARSD